MQFSKSILKETIQYGTFEKKNKKLRLASSYTFQK